MNQKRNKKRCLIQLIGKLNNQYNKLNLNDFNDIIEFWDSTRQLQVFVMSMLNEHSNKINKELECKYSDKITKSKNDLIKLINENPEKVPPEFEKYFKENFNDLLA